MRLYVSCLLFALVAALLPPTSAEAQISDVDCVALFDADGTRVARAYQYDPDVAKFYLGHNGFSVPFVLIEADFIIGEASQIWFTDASCSTTPYVRFQSNVYPAPVSALIGQEVYYNDPSAVSQQALFLSFRSDGNGSCQPTNTSQSAAPVIGQFTLPQYTPPFFIEPEACFTLSPMVTALTPYSLGAMALVLAFTAYVMRKGRFATVEMD